VQTVLLELVHVVLGFFKTFPGQYAFALFMNLEHMKIRLGFGPTEDFLKNVGDILHEIDRVVPANDKISGLQRGFWLFLWNLDCNCLNLWIGAS